MLEKLTMKMVAIGLAVMLVLAGLYWIYNSIYSSGYKAATIECDQKFAQLQKETNEKLFSLQTGLQNISGDLGVQQASLASDISTILQTIRKKPTVVVKDGKCVPSQEFVNSINKAIDRANKK